MILDKIRQVVRDEFENEEEELSSELYKLRASVGVMTKLLQAVVKDLELPEQGELSPWKQNLLQLSRVALSDDAARAEIERIRKLEQVARAARKINKRRCTGSKADREDYGAMIPCSELHDLHQALADLDGEGCKDAD